MRKAAAARAVTGRSATGPKRAAALPSPVRGRSSSAPRIGAPPPRLELVQPAAPPAEPPKPANPFLSLLLSKRQELTGNLEDTKFDTLAKMGRVAEDDQAQMSHEEFISLQRNSMDYQALRQVNAAIDRLNSGEYGICGACEEPISEKRLKAIPWAKYCVTCQDRVHLTGSESDPDEEEASESW